MPLGLIWQTLLENPLINFLIGTVLAHWMNRHHAEWLQEQLDRGGLLLWVRTPDAEAEQRALGILRKHSAHDVHIHRLPAKSA